MKFHPVQLARLERIAKAATPGPWVEDDGNIFVQPTEDAYLDVAKAPQDVKNFEANAAFIAAFNPQTCLRLIAWIRSLERKEYRSGE